MRRIEEESNAGRGCHTEQILWAIVDRQALPGWRRRARRLLGSQEAVEAVLSEHSLFDRRLRAWASPDPVPAQRCALPAEADTAPAPALARRWLRRVLGPSSILRLAQ